MGPVLTARLTGVTYLVIIVSAPLAELVVRGGSIVSGDAAATAANILAREPLWRGGAVLELITASCDALVAVALYVLLRPVDRFVSLLAAVFRLVLVALSAVKVLLHLLPLVLLKGGASLGGFSAGQLQELSYLSLQMHGRAYDIMLFFFGLHCLLIGWLIARADFLPRVFGPLLALAGVGYAANTIAKLTAPAFASQLFPWILLPGLVAELGLALWLVVRGVDAARWRAQGDAGLPSVTPKP